MKNMTSSPAWRRPPRQRPARRRRARYVLIWTLAALVVAVLAAPLSGYLLLDNAIAQTAATDAADESAGMSNERANFWRAVRGGVEGYTAVRGQETGVLIQNGGQNWRFLREGPVSYYGGRILLAALILIVAYAILFGRLRLINGREGMTVQRWNLFDRTLHWYTAILFIVLALTGLSLLYGRELLIPHIGKDAFAAYAAIAKDVHNYLGPFFALGLIIELLKWMHHNIPKWHDVVWAFKGGGFIARNVHPSTGRMNAGEKLWYWLLFFAGLGVIGSGFVMDFPIFGQTRDTMQLAHLIHVSGSVLLIAFALGHIYLAAIGTEGTLEGMVTGRVDTEWAKQHHDLWYDDLLAKGARPIKTPEAVADSDFSASTPSRTT